MEAKINITGQIGTSYNADGSVNVLGVELQDIITQVQANKDAIKKIFVINSGGGSVQAGRAIAKYIASLPEAYTVAKELCGSIATEIHLAVALERRSIVEGTEYFLHAPLLRDVSGNADELLQMADYVKETEKEMLSMYVKATGVDKAAIEGLMKQETFLTADQCVQLHFASAKIPAIEVSASKKEKVIAFYNKENKKSNQKPDKMKSLKEKFESLFADISEKMGLTAEWKEEKLKDGKTIKIDMAGEAMAIGDVITDANGQPTPNASYVMADETVIKTGEDSKITEINKPEPTTADPNKKDSDEVAAIKAENEKLKSENEEYKKQFVMVEAKLTTLGKSIQSSGTPRTEGATQFRKRNVQTDQEKTLSDWKEKREKQIAQKRDQMKKKIEG